MGVWREVQEILYQRWAAAWVTGAPGSAAVCPYMIANETGFDPPNGLWAAVRVVRMPGGQGTLGSPGNRKMDRVGIIFIDLRVPPGEGYPNVDEYGERAAKIFENCRILSPYDIRFAAVEPGEASDIDKGRWWGLSVEGRFEYQDYS